MKRTVSKFKKFNRTVLRKKTPLLNFTVLELFILGVVVVSGVSAIAIRNQSPSATTKNTTASQSENNGNESTYSAGTSQAPQTNTPTTPTQSTPSTSKSSGSNTTANLPDQYGCIPQTSGYDSCVKYAKQNALTLWCGDQAKKAGDTYSAAASQAQAAYNTVMAEWNAVKDQPYQTHSPYDEYAADAKTKYNAIEKPAYATYASTINSLNSQGCNVIKAYTDTSWAGY